MPYVDPQERRAYLEHLERVVKHLRIEISSSRNDGTSLHVRPGTAVKPGKLSAEFRLVDNNEEGARVDLLVEASTEEAHNFHVGRLQEIIGGRQVYHFRDVREDASKTLIAVCPVQRYHRNGTELLAWHVEQLMQMHHAFGPYLRQYFNHP